MAKSAKKGRCDAEDAADEIRRENGEKITQLYLNSSFFILHSSFIIMRCLLILINSGASTLVDEICPIASKDKAIAKAKLIPLVFLSASRTSLRPLRPPCLCVPLASRASRSHVMAKNAKKGRRDAKVAEDAGLAWWVL